MPIMTQCKNGVNLGFTEPCEQETTVLHRKWKNEKKKKNQKLGKSI